jgi:hypothetical protein
LGIGDWGLGPIPNPQSPIPNPQSPRIKIKIINLIHVIYNYYKNLFNKKIKQKYSMGAKLCGCNNNESETNDPNVISIFIIYNFIF